MAPKDDQRFTLYGYAIVGWLLIIPFQYGWHISALNQIQAVLTCQGGKEPPSSAHGLPTCVPMNDAQFSSITSIFCLGGLLGSLACGNVMDKWGRKGAAKASAGMFALGAGLMGVAWNMSTLLAGRFFIGVGAGGLSVTPLFLAEIAPAHLKGPIGSLSQVGVVLGIMSSQIAGFVVATPTLWRLALISSAGLAALQLIVSPVIIESPVWLQTQSRNGEVDGIYTKLYHGLPPREDDAEDPLLAHTAEEDMPLRTKESLTIPQLLRASDLRRTLAGVCLLFLSQQISGVNAILYYSNAILAKSFPDLGPYVSLAITLVNVIMTFPAIFLIERLGRKTLLYSSAAGAITCLVLCGIGLNANSVALSSFSILAFITCFAVGMGPVPFVLIPEMSPLHAVSALSSVGLATHWIANYTVGQSFLPLRNWLAGGNPDLEGRVFYVFATVFALTIFGFSRTYRN